jgi:cobyrinic acid a,c-diamide synthase
MQAFVVAGTHSGVGKTTLTLGLLAALHKRGQRVQGFKVGPDFIDPAHHAAITGTPSFNLDGWMLSREYNQECFARALPHKDIGVIEGMMGLFDGYDGKTEAGSTAEMAKWLNLPVILVIDASAMARSVAALVHGFQSFDPDLNVAGVIFNKIGGKGHLQYL